MAGKRIPIEQARQVAIRNLQTILTVAEWADIMGYSVSTFRRLCRKTFKQSAGKLLSEVRITYIRTLWTNDPGLSAYELAKRAGLKDEKALYQFLQTHPGMARESCEKKSRQSCRHKVSRINERMLLTITQLIC